MYYECWALKNNEKWELDKQGEYRTRPSEFVSSHYFPHVTFDCGSGPL